MVRYWAACGAGGAGRRARAAADYLRSLRPEPRGYLIDYEQDDVSPWGGTANQVIHVRADVHPGRP